jgi:hypothetical protein
MVKFIILLILSFFITQALEALFGNKEAGHEAKKDVDYKVTLDQGIIGCLSKDKFKEAANYYTKRDFTKIKKLIDEEICFFFAKDSELSAPEGTCSSDHGDDELFPFKSPKFMLLQPYLPCFAVR